MYANGGNVSCAMLSIIDTHADGLPLNDFDVAGARLDAGNRPTAGEGGLTANRMVMR